MQELIITEGQSAMNSLISPQVRSGEGRSNYMRILHIRIKISKWQLKLLDTNNVQKQIKLKRKIAAAELRLAAIENIIYPKPIKKPKSYKGVYK